MNSALHKAVRDLVVAAQTGTDKDLYAVIEQVEAELSKDEMLYKEHRIGFSMLPETGAPGYTIRVSIDHASTEAYVADADLRHSVDQTRQMLSHALQILADKLKKKG